MKVEVLRTENCAIVEIVNNGRFTFRSYSMKDIIQARQSAQQLSEVLGCKWEERKEE